MSWRNTSAKCPSSRAPDMTIKHALNESLLLGPCLRCITASAPHALRVS
jgi:hypothetical protein